MYVNRELQAGVDVLAGLAKRLRLCGVGGLRQQCFTTLPLAR